MAWSRLRRLARVGDCLWASPSDLWGVLGLIPRRSAKSTSSGLLVKLSALILCRSLRRPSVGLGVVPISSWTTKWIGLHKGDLACRQARKPRDKNCVSIVPRWLGFHWYSWLFIPCHGGITLPIILFLLLSYSLVVLVAWVPWQCN
jgi:hypothetical protein